jgi:glycosyltransferase involved in cell wall biosynthesis
VFAHPALYEPFGLAVLEAGRHGCALVLSDVPTLRELWDGAALFAAPHDPAQFRAHFSRLIDRPEERRALGAVARIRAQLFRVDTMAGAYRALYADLTGSDSTKKRAVA